MSDVPQLEEEGVRQRGYWLVVAAFLAAIGVMGVLAFAPLSTSIEARTEVTIQETTQDGEHEQQMEQHQEVVRRTIPEEDGWGVVLGVAVPLLLVAGLPLLVPGGRRAVLVRGVSTGLLTAGMVVVMSASVFLAPVALLMLVATILGAAER